jgi:hypothetical protein
MAGRRPILGGLVLAGVCLAVLLAVYLHLSQGARVSMVGQTVSDYVLAPGGAGTFAAMCLALAVGSLGLVAAALAPRQGAALAVRDQVVVLLLTAWCLGLTVAALFPTDPMGGRMSLNGEAHRWAIVLAFVSLPSAGRLLARSRPGEAAAVGFWSKASFASLGVLMISYIPVVFPWLTRGPVLIGLSERLLLAVDLSLLVAMAWPLVRRATAGSGQAETVTERGGGNGFVIPAPYRRPPDSRLNPRPKGSVP